MDDRRVKKLTHVTPLNKQIHKNSSDCSLCGACKLGITDEFYLRAGSRIYHEACLQCSVCQVALDEQSTCFLKGVQILCRQDYNKYFSNKCSKCDRFVHPNDWIRRACDSVYHLTCFACYICERQLSTGEEYSLDSGHILCKMHVIDGNEEKNDDNKHNKTKRIRTAFNEEQLQILQASFEIDQNPDGQELDQISQIIGLSKRVIQVWFQNTRARQKKQRATSRLRTTSSSSKSSISNTSGDRRPLNGTSLQWRQDVRTLMDTVPNITSINRNHFRDQSRNHSY